MKSALIIIDMQRDLFASPKHDADGLVERLNALGHRIRASGGIVIFIQHEGLPGQPFDPETPGWQLLPNLLVEPGDIVVRKASCDAFLNTDLLDVLRAKAVDRLVITGCASDYCVDTTVRSALARSYKTVVPADGHTVSDRPHLSAEKIIAHHNAIWGGFHRPGGAGRDQPLRGYQLAGGRQPKIAVPTRTCVAPNFTASSKSSLMPMLS